MDSLFAVPEQCKRKAINLALKKRIVDASSSMSVNQLSVHFGLPNSTIRKILSIRQKIQQAIEEGKDGTRAKLTGSRNPELDTAMQKWLQQARENGVPVNGPQLKVSVYGF
jgi:hypothetical protein